MRGRADECSTRGHGLGRGRRCSQLLAQLAQSRESYSTDCSLTTSMHWRHVWRMRAAQHVGQCNSVAHTSTNGVPTYLHQLLFNHETGNCSHRLSRHAKSCDTRVSTYFRETDLPDQNAREGTHEPAARVQISALGEQ